MEIKDRGFAARLVVVLVMLLVAAAVTAAVLHQAASIATSRSTAASALSHQQAPDAAERNGVYYAAMCGGYNDASPDARDRNLQLSGC